MGAPHGNKNASGPHAGRSQHGKKSGFRNTLKKRYGAKLHQHGKKSGLRRTRFGVKSGGSFSYDFK